MLPKTILCDIDGVLLEHPGDLVNVYNKTPIIISGTLNKIQEWHMKGYTIILLTSRFPSMKNITEKQLEEARISYHSLIMGINKGSRVVINDLKPSDDTPTAEAYNLIRNVGIKDLNI